MGRPLDYGVARSILEGEFAPAEEMFKDAPTPDIPKEVIIATERLFSSSTQAFREALVGVVLARIIDPKIDIRFPYMKQAEDAFNGRTLDEEVVNPFLVTHEIPCSKAPYLSALRRNVTFEKETARGVRDPMAFFAMLEVIDYLQQNGSPTAHGYLRYLLSRFVALRDASDIPLAKVQRLSLEQHETLIARLLSTPSGGRIPVLLSVAALSTMRDHFRLPWELSWQGINVADRASGAGGDITISRDGSPILTIEVTERQIDRSRVVATFNGKISPAGLDDYLFLFTDTAPEEEARAVARQYFAQGHDISFITIKDWIVATLATVGPRGRSLYFEHVVKLLGSLGVPAALKLAWNENIRGLLAEAGPGTQIGH